MSNTKTNDTRTHNTTDQAHAPTIVRTRDEFGRGSAHVMPAYKAAAAARFAHQIGGEYRDR